MADRCRFCDDEFGGTSIPGIFVAGDVSGIEEASSAMIGGRIAGITAAQYLGFIDKEEQLTKCEENKKALDVQFVRECLLAKNRGKLVEKTEEGIPVSMNTVGKRIYCQ